MVSENYARAYKEVIEVLKYTKREDVNKIPQCKIVLWKQNMKKDYNFKIDPNKSLEEQNLSSETKAIIANTFKKYWATDYQRGRIEAKEKYDREQAEREKIEKYNPNEIFKNKQNNILEEKEENVSMIEYKNFSIFQRIKEFIKNIFKATKK